jgi:predicted nucleic acid-binding protein
MPTAGSPPELLVDTSVAVALSVADHERHQTVSRALRGRSLGLAGHAAFETFSVLTRLPPPARRSPATVGRLLDASFPVSRFLGARATASLLDELGRAGIAGGAVYDALVGACANEHALPLATSDRRALETYRALNVRVEWLG